MIEPTEPITNNQVVSESGEPLNLMVIAGDPSGDRHTSKLVSHLKKLTPGLKVWGVGGPHMEAEGVEIFINNSEFAVVGMIEVVQYLPKMIPLAFKLLNEVPMRKPQAVLLVDFGGFNLRFAPHIRKRFPNLPLIYCISPQLWASRPWRIKTVVKNISKMLVIFPFEEDFYREKGVDASFVGHPLLTSLPAKESLPTKEEFCKQLNLDASKPIIAVFPGSRRGEISSHMPVALEAIDWMSKMRDDVQFVISQANDRVAGMMQEELKKSKIDTSTGRFVMCNAEQNYPLMANCDIVWAKSGTTTLEATLFGKPMIVFYRGAWSSFLLVLILKNLQRVAWPNILYKGDLVPELLQLDCRAELLVRYSVDLLDVPALRKEISEKLLTLRNQLGQGEFAPNAASEILKVLSLSKTRETATRENL